MLTLIFIYLNPLLMHLYYFVDDGSVGSVLFDVALINIFSTQPKKGVGTKSSVNVDY